MKSSQAPPLPPSTLLPPAPAPNSIAEHAAMFVAANAASIHER